MMTDAPERKYLTPNGGLPTGNWAKSDLLGYVRPDLYDAQAARIAELEAAINPLIKDVVRYANACVIDGYPEQLPSVQAGIKALKGTTNDT